MEKETELSDEEYSRIGYAIFSAIGNCDFVDLGRAIMSMSNSYRHGLAVFAKEQSDSYILHSEAFLFIEKWIATTRKHK